MSLIYIYSFAIHSSFNLCTDLVSNQPTDRAVQNVERGIHDKIVIQFNNQSVQPFARESDSLSKDLVKSVLNGQPIKRQSKRDTESILQSYQHDFGHNHDRPIVASQKGKTKSTSTLPNKLILLRDHPMKPSPSKSYESISFESVAFVLTKFILDTKEEYIMSNNKSIHRWDQVLQTLSVLSKDFNNMVNDVYRLRTLDFSPLKLPRLDYINQEKIDEKRVDMATALMIEADLIPGVAVRYLSGEYTAEHRNVDSILSYVHGHVDEADEKNMERFLREGVPSSFDWVEPRENKMARLDMGNQPSIERNEELVRKTINKEDRYSHVLPMARWIPRFSPYCRHNYQGLITKNGKGRVVWDETTIPRDAPHLTVINRIAPRDDIIQVSYGDVPKRFMMSILNIRASFPDEEIFIPAADITACFRTNKTHPDLTGALGFILQDHYHLSTSMVFGHVESASVWEPTRRILEKMTLVEFNGPKDLEQIHKYYLDMLNWDDFETSNPPPGTLQRSAKCSKITGVVDSQGRFVQPKPGIFVDDALPVSTRRYIRRLLAALIEAIFNILGHPDTAVRRNPLSMEKWIDHRVSWQSTLLGFRWNTRKLTIGIPEDYLATVRSLIVQKGWAYRKVFTVPDISKLIGKIGHIAQAVPWVYHLISHLYASVSYALTKNRELLASNSKEFNDLLKVVKGEASYQILGQGQDDNQQINLNVVNYAKSRVAKMPHLLDNQYPIVKSMRNELNFLIQLLEDRNINWHSPIAHNVERDPTFNSHADACLEEMGGFSIKLAFMWHVSFPEDICKRTIKYVKSGSHQIGINVLEFAAIIINYAAALTAIATMCPGDDPYPILLNHADNTSAVKWVRLCTNSIIGRRLAILFCFLIMDEPLGINAKWLAGDENEIADAISRFKSKMSTNTSSLNYTNLFQSLKQRYPALRNCRTFQPSQSLLSILWRTILTESLPTLEEVRLLKRNSLGKLVI